MADYRTMFDPGKYLGGWELVDRETGKPRDYVLEISRVVADKLQIPGSSKSERKPIVYFKGASKPLACNKTNAKTIAGLYGNDTTQWVGKRIVLYFDPSVTMKGVVVGGIRVRPVVPRSSAKTDEHVESREPPAETLEKHAAAHAKSEGES